MPEPPTAAGASEQPTLAYAGPCPEAAAAPPGRVFGDYELLAEIGRGGMGIVYQARQRGLNRVVALKMILPGHLSKAEDLQRFRTEAESTACLQHPHIVAVHAVGEVDGQHFFSMDFIDGPSLAKRLADGPLPGPVAAGYVRTIARALHHAHQRGILHRDLKPSNILLDAADQPHVTDFGLAKRLGTDSGQTRTGAVLGTPSYMAPEQAAGKIHELGRACDVYGLGAVLYECLTGRPPFRSDTPVDTLLHVLERDPAPPRLLNPKVDPDLETICLKCLEKDPARRYPSAEALAADLDRYLAGEPISVRSFNVLDRLARSLDRSHYIVEFRSYGTMLLLFALIICAEQLVVFLLTRHGPPYPHAAVMATRASQFLLMGAVFCRYRWRRLLPTSQAERQLWSIWIGYLAACWLLAPVAVFLDAPGRPFDLMMLYPMWSMLSGLAFFAMGGSYWGRCYAFGLAFFAAAVLMPWQLPLAPLLFGFLWLAVLGAVGWRLHHLAGQSEQGKAS